MEPPENYPAGLSLKCSLDALGKTVREHPHEKPEATPPAEAVQLPLWPKVKRAVPSFAAIQGRGRRYMKGELLAAQRGIEIRFTGMQLDQSDLDVWE